MNTNSRAKHIDFIILDLLCIEVSFVLAYLLRIDRNQDDTLFEFYRTMDIMILLIYLALALFNPFHSKILRRGHGKEFFNILKTNVEIMSVLIVILFALKNSATYSRLMLGIFFVTDIILMFLARTVWKKHLIRRFQDGKGVTNAVVVTSRRSLNRFLNALQKNNNGCLRFCGIVLLDEDVKDHGLSTGLHNRNRSMEMTEEQNAEKEEICGIPVISYDVLLDFVKTDAIGEAFILAKRGTSGRLANEFLNMGITVHIGMNLEMERLSNVQVGQVGRYTMLTSSINPATPGELAVKRLFDILVSIIGLVFTGIFYLIFAPIIKKQSPGPAFFVQERVGKNGKVFKMYKFRSMYMDAEARKKDLMQQNEMSGLMFKMDDDPRIMPVGKFLRKTSIDEFPQFFNILKGDMSLVGTRPPTLDEFRQYDPHHLSRLAMKPGLTGMWQVSGRSDITDFEEVVKLDNEYIRNFSIGLDLKIIFKTFKAVFEMKGSK